MQDMHASGITHGDMKPSNVVVWRDSQGIVQKARVIDCQKVKQFDLPSSSSAAASSSSSSSARRSKAFEAACQRDLLTFQKHIDKNQAHRGRPIKKKKKHGHHHHHHHHHRP
jgi:tRNA A-37 threonylcarbamoyl transferase component Bud32